jgi:hypothetical protein
MRRLSPFTTFINPCSHVNVGDKKGSSSILSFLSLCHYNYFSNSFDFLLVNVSSIKCVLLRMLAALTFLAIHISKLANKWNIKYTFDKLNSNRIEGEWNGRQN